MVRFNIRVYGILTDESRRVLVSDEYIKGRFFTKFPGGGLEFGEGTRDCLRREFMEEMNLKVTVDGHIYTTDYFQLSAFNPGHQILSIYYFVSPLEDIAVRLSTMPFHFDETQLRLYEKNQETESFRFIEWDDFSEDSVTLPIDKIVAKMVKQRHSNERAY